MREGAEKALVVLAEQTDPHTVRKAGAHTVALFNPDGTEPTGDDPAHPYRELRLGKRRDGRYGMTGILDPETGVLLETLLSPLAKPRPAANGERDPRTAPERRGDALAELLQRTHAAADVPFEAGHRPTVMVTMRLADITARHAARGGAGAKLNDLPISVESARRYACDAQIIPTVLGTQGEVLDLGRSERLATPAQRRALTMRDKGCIKCGRPPRWCQAHHLIHWLDGGRTDLDNLCLLCTECHRLIHHSEWRIEMIDHKPMLHPPPWIKRD